MEDFLAKIWVTHEDVVYTQYPYKQCFCMLFLLMVHLYKNELCLRTNTDNILTFFFFLTFS